ncbi:hypothetical protein F0562_031703 [Nyssa sinensis]|uniref:Protein WUSCHEL n=1 Tax=Nyssa sinensis TaxID=561372 RepID=A0A5J5AUY6_9ASTE|nr:hypothetical protein F0562_031703 [Nyssa sinensis]
MDEGMSGFCIRPRGGGGGGGGGGTKCGRWNPTAEQVKVLTDLFRSGLRTPSTDQIQKISSQLSFYGKIESKNVFYWFQNHKARERQKRRRVSVSEQNMIRGEDKISSSKHFAETNHISEPDRVIETLELFPLNSFASQPVKFSDVGCDIPELKGDNFKMWKERVLLHLGWMDINYDIRKDEPPVVTNTSTEVEIALYEHWERSNRLNVMFINTKISASICGSVDQHTKVRDLLKAIDEQFVTSDKVLASTLIMKFCSTRLDTVKGVREHIMKMRDTTA